MRGLLEGWGEVFEAFGDGGGPFAGGGVTEVHAVGAGFSGDVAGGDRSRINRLEIQFPGALIDPTIDRVLHRCCIFGSIVGEDPNNLNRTFRTNFTNEGTDVLFVFGDIGIACLHEVIHPVRALLDDDDAGSEPCQNLRKFRRRHFLGFLAVLVFRQKILLS